MRTEPLQRGYTNRSLFADYYLEHLLPQLEDWSKEDNLHEVYTQLQDLYASKRTLLQSANEAQLEQELLRPLLDILWGSEAYIVQPTLPTPTGNIQPDYALFATSQARQQAEPSLGAPEFWRSVSVVAEAKAWDSSLDRRQGTHENPSAQICLYLYRTGVRWGILTNGRHWRLYERELSRTGGVYYEVDLPALLEQNDPEPFRYFFHFFRREAFLPDEEGLSFVERVLKGSQEYAVQVGERLRENVYDALRILIDGFLRFPTNRLSADDPEMLQRVYEKSLIVLYRLLFLLYAEDRGLLPISHIVYRDYCLQKIHREVNESLRSGREYYPRETRFWNALLTLTRIIDEGLPDNGELVLPAYNGGLFKPDAHPEVAHTPLPEHPRWNIGDAYLAKVIDLLAYERDQYDQLGVREVDYGSLEVQHLGSIYEGLLELQPRIASETLYERVENGRSVFTADASSIPSESPRMRRIEPGRVYLTTDRGERKATGSYYTPKPIVNYIVERTLSPILDRVAQQVAQLRPQIEAQIRQYEDQRAQELLPATPEQKQLIEEKYQSLINQTKMRLLEPYLSVKVLDPAMGSGHFMVGVADYISLRMANDSNLMPLDAFRQDDAQTYYKRLVVERCLHGVDLNPLAVELAKLSLWFHTVSRGRALSFLDHRLRCGNTLIGARIEQDLMTEPPQLDRNGRVRMNSNGQLTLGFTETLTSQHLAYFLDTFRQITEAPTGDAQIERQKDLWYRELEKVRDKFRAVANCWLAPYFGVKTAPELYAQAVEALRNPTDWETLQKQEWFQSAQEVAQRYHFFHWELEFPELFFEPNGLKPTDLRGFDAVVGNPPYLFGELIPEEIRAVSSRYEFASGQYDVYWLFYEIIVKLLLKQDGLHGYIVPDAILVRDEVGKIRHCLTEKHHLVALGYAGAVFDEPEVSAAIVVWQKRPAEPSHQVRLAQLQGEEFVPIGLRNQSNFLQIPNTRWLLFLNEESFGFVLKVFRQTRPLGEFARISRGEELGKKNLATTASSNTQPIIVGEDIRSYCRLLPTRYISKDRVRKKSEFYQSPKLVLPKTGEKLFATVDTDGFVTLQSVYNLHPDQRLSVYCLCALLNSRLMNFVVSQLFTGYKGIFPQLNQSTIEELPIPGFQSTVDDPQSASALGEGTKLYEALLNPEQAPPSDYEKFLQQSLGKWCAQQKTAGQTGFLHDFLAYLAEQMIRLNEQKQTESTGFLQWLADYIGVSSVDILSNHERLKTYYEVPYPDFQQTLRQNRLKLRVDPDARQHSQRIRKEFDDSIQSLKPTLERIERTDRLIDWVVYQLYGLTPEEVQMVESAGS